MARISGPGLMAGFRFMGHSLGTFLIGAGMFGAGADKFLIQLSIFPTATLPFVILTTRITLLLLTDFINKAGLKMATEKLQNTQVMDAVLGSAVCALAALGVSAVASGHAWKHTVPLVFIAILLLIAALFGARAGIMGTVLAALVFASFLFGPGEKISVASESARLNIGWMLLIGIFFSFLFAPSTAGFRRR